jgi:hypothetical protein
MQLAGVLAATVQCWLMVIWCTGNLVVVNAADLDLSNHLNATGFLCVVGLGAIEQVQLEASI